MENKTPETKNIEVVFGISNKKFYISNEFENLNNLEKIFILSNTLQTLENTLMFAKDIVLDNILKPNIPDEYYEKAKNDNNFYKELLAYLIDSNFLEVTKDYLTPFYYKIKVRNFPTDVNKLKDPQVLKNLEVEITDSVSELEISQDKEINLIDVLTIYVILLKYYIDLFNNLSEEELKILEEEKKAIDSIEDMEDLKGKKIEEIITN